jgi:uncharacterized protein YndB with AHSA1/START domain
MIEVSRPMHASPEQVFAVLSNGWLYPSWVVGASRMRDVEEHWPAVGSRLHHSFGVWPVLLDDNTEVLRCEPPHRLVLQARGWPAGEATVDLRIDRAPDGCVVTLLEDATHGPGRLLPRPVRVAAIAPRNRETLKRLAFLAEGRPAVTAAQAPRSAR